jgi:hypothetical protein
MHAPRDNVFGTRSTGYGKMQIWVEQGFWRLCRNSSFAPLGLDHLPLSTQGLRPAAFLRLFAAFMMNLCHFPSASPSCDTDPSGPALNTLLRASQTAEKTLVLGGAALPALQ